MKRLGHPVILALLMLLLSLAPSAMAVEKRYFTYDSYQALIALCPEIKGAQLLGLAPTAVNLWKNGQLEMPEDSHLVRGDFNHDGQADVAIAITDGASNYVLIAEPTGSGWKRTGLVRVKLGIKEWNGRALQVGDSAFIAWDGKKYRLEQGPLATYCNAYDPPAFRGVMVKLTYVGPQNEPYPGLLISSFYHLPNIGSFKPHRRGRCNYGNDDLGVMWQLTLSPEELREFATALNRSAFLPAAEDRKGSEAVSHSLSMLDVSSSQRPNYFEVFLFGKETVQLLQSFATKIEPNNSAGAKLLREYAKMFGP